MRNRNKGLLKALLSPTALDDYNPVYIAIEGAIFLIGCAFWIATQLGVQTLYWRVWGKWANFLPEEFWAGIMMLSSALIVSGLINPPNKIRVVTGCLIQCTQMIALGISSVFSGGDFVVAIYTLLLFLPMHIVLALGACNYVSK